jgi:riboflavin synthase
MFTGIIEDLGKVGSLIRFKDRVVLTIAARFTNELHTGDSVAVNGVCLTVTEKLMSSFKVDIIGETLEKSSINLLKVGEYVNLERAISASGRFDGHIVQGHVDCKSIIINIINAGQSREIEISVPDNYRKYLASKGSIAVDGVSLTVASMDDRYFRVAVIPHTALVTNLFHKKIGDYVNLEFDVLAKYVESVIGKSDINDLASIKGIKIDDEFLKKAGFLN